MTLAQLIPLVLQGSLALSVFSLGLSASRGDGLYLFRRPTQLAKSLLSMNVIMLIFAIVVAALLDLHPAVKIALVALAASPMPPILPKKQRKAGGTSSYAVGLLAASALAAIVIVPVAVGLAGRYFGTDSHMPAGAVAWIVLKTVILPLVVGLIVGRIAPGLAERLAGPISLVATLLLVVAVLPILIRAVPALRSMVGNGTLTVLALFSLVGVAVGHLLGGPNPDDRTVLALATATRHPGMAMAIAHLNFPELPAVGAVVLWHLIVGGLVTLPYVRRRKRRHASSQSTA